MAALDEAKFDILGDPFGVRNISVEDMEAAADRPTKRVYEVLLRDSREELSGFPKDIAKKILDRATGFYGVDLSFL